MTKVKDSAERAATLASAKLSESADAVKAGYETAKAKVGGGVDSFPVVALAAGIAVGAVVGALLPKTKKEGELLGEYGGEIVDRAKAALTAGKDAGKAELDAAGFSTDAAGKQVGKLIESIAKVAETAGSAAIGAVRK
ncbi:hypothetical protein [Sphingomonas montanisoli]|uniref:DUF883 family protein n=1 Tax=Sphingomonas montanisoli TaxID=2606412 RepID=A0A5D9C2N4_9SPHN|nr:hypothetical protein [Sphingomonas montanisoli]TZG25994.1 hypothetical protein FYJ91_13570 [Sphingomonas montanisoli]